MGVPITLDNTDPFAGKLHDIKGEISQMIKTRMMRDSNYYILLCANVHIRETNEAS